MPEGRVFLTKARDLAGPVLAWGIWAAMTLAMVVLVRQYNRNMPFQDDFVLTAVMTGHEPISLQWVWAQHNEHRPVISRLILAALARTISNDFRVGKYFNVGLLSAAAASMLLLARQLRGFTSVTDAVLPLAILNLAQAESLMIAFAMNLVLTTVFSVSVINTTLLADRRPAWSTTLRFGMLIVVLPLCGGSGLVMLPPLVLWMIGYVCFAWWSRREHGGASRAIGVGLLMICAGVVSLYLGDYDKPSYHPPAPSLRAAASTALEFLSTAVCSDLGEMWWVAGSLLLLVVAFTILRLVVVAARTPTDRPAAFGLVAFVVAMLAMTAAIGASRSGLGPRTALAGRYVTLTAPLLCALYVAWLAYGTGRARSATHVGILLTVCLMFPANTQFGLRYARYVRSLEARTERRLRAQVSWANMSREVSPDLFPDAKGAYDCFTMLKAARFGAFQSFNDGRVASMAAPDMRVRR
jgi:hypothetical protein